ncbi:MAG: PaaI family thioesterase [Acidimicrobiia bacterium]
MTDDFAPFHFEAVPGGPKSPDEMALAGFERSKRELDGEGTRPAIQFLTGMRPIEVDEGRIVFVMPATSWLASARGEISTTAASFLADAPLGGAVMTAMPPRTAIPTVELSLAYVEATASIGEDLYGVGKLISHDAVTAMAEVEVYGGERLMARGLTRVMIEPTLVLVPDIDRREPASEAPYRRSLLGEPITDDVWGSVSGLDVLMAQVSGELPLPPIAWLLGLRPTEAAEGVIGGQVIASGWMASPSGTLYGGFVAAVLEWAISATAQTLALPGGRERVLDMKVNYLRPLIPQRQLLSVVGRLTHRGRRIVVGEAALSREDGKVIAQAVGTARLEQPS